MTGPSEKALLNDSLIAVTAQPDTMAWRNNSGMAWQGTPVRAGIGQTVVVRPGMTILQDARPIRFSVPGAPDILGVTRGIAWSIETKTRTGRQSDEQRAFARAFGAAGGRYALVRSVDDALAVPRSIIDGG